MSTAGERRVYPPKELESFLGQIVVDQGLFETKQKALMFAASLGRYREERKELVARGEGIRIDIFQRGVDDVFIDALAVSVTNDLGVLSPDRTEERIRIFEECAFAGLREMHRVAAQPTDTLEEFIILTQAARAAAPEDLPGIDSEALAALESY